MLRETAFFSILVPALLPLFLGCIVLFLLVDKVLTRLGLYRQVWHPALFRASLFVCIFGGVGLLLQK
jgi:hypothetical protein